MAEQRLVLELPVELSDGQIVVIAVTGKFDEVYLWGGDEGERTLIDYKSTSWLPKEPKPEHIAQIKVYNLLLRENGQPSADALALDYFSMQGEMVFPVPLWDFEATREYLAEKARPVVEAILSIEVAQAQDFEAMEGWLPPKVNPLDPETGGWKCDYCDHSDGMCWPDGVPEAPRKTRKKRSRRKR